MSVYSQLHLPHLLDAFAANAPAPGGGAAAAMTGAAGASLLIMAGRISKSPDITSGEAAATIDRLMSARQTLVALIDRDPEAYARVIAARRMPADDESSATRRQAAIESAMPAATEAPLDTMRACRAALADAPAVVERTSRSVYPDIAVAIELLHAALRGAGSVVDANLLVMGDSSYVSRTRSERQQLESESAVDAERVRSQLSRDTM